MGFICEPISKANPPEQLENQPFYPMGHLVFRPDAADTAAKLVSGNRLRLRHPEKNASVAFFQSREAKHIRQKLRDELYGKQ